MLAGAGEFTAVEPMGVEVSGEEGELEEDQAGEPDGRGASEDGEELFGGHGFDEEEEEGREEDCGGVQRARRGHEWSREA